MLDLLNKFMDGIKKKFQDTYAQSPANHQNNVGGNTNNSNGSMNYNQPIATSPTTSSSNWSSTNAGAKNGNWLAQTVKSTVKDKITVYDMKGGALELSISDQTNSGGEGIIYTYAKNANILIKIYKQDTLDNDEKMADIRKRILDMISIYNMKLKKEKILSNSLAWPLMAIYDEDKKIIGFAMKKCEGIPFTALRGPMNITRHFPSWDRERLVNIAIDFVRKVKILNSHKIYINDFNPSNFLVDRCGNVSLIDCDSFQIPSADGSINITKTYFSSYVAPELLRDKSLLEKPRTEEHVNFGVAMHVFGLLMCGLHPYVYFDPSRKLACGTPDENLLEGRCPLGRGSGCNFPEGPWYNMWSYMTTTLKEVFINTFRKEEGHLYPEKRTSLGNLISELQKFKYEMSRDTHRRELVPSQAKSAKYLGENNKNSDFYGKIYNPRLI